MEEILAKAGSQAVTFAIKSGVAMATNYAVKSLTQFIATIPDNVGENEKRALERSQSRLQLKIQVITPAIDLIELISARGNTSLNSTLLLVNQLKNDITEFESRIEKINDSSLQTASAKERQIALKEVQIYIKDLIERIEEAIPLISLALTASGANLSSRMPDSVSPGRFLQAGRFLSEADSKYDGLVQMQPKENRRPISVQVGPSFVLVMYTIFYGQTTHVSWKEEFRRCRIRLWRVNGLGAQALYAKETDNEGRLKERKYLSNDTDDNDFQYRYVMTIEESFKDGRYHDEDEERPRFRVLDLATVTRLFFSASGRLLQIDESKSPVLVLKLNSIFDTHLAHRSPVKTKEDSDDETEGESEEEDLSFIGEANNHVEWLAFEQYYTVQDDTVISKDLEDPEEEDSEDSSSEEEDENVGGALSRKLESLSLETSDTQKKELDKGQSKFVPPDAIPASNFKKQFSKEKVSLSHLEYLIRLSALQSNDQESIYNTTDERIALYLTDENSDQSRRGARSTSSKGSEFPNSGSRKATAYQGSRKPSTAGTTKRNSPKTPENKDNDQETPALTPWERDRLETRRQILLKRKDDLKE